MENIITTTLNADSCISILTPFSLDSYFYNGKIRIDYKGVELEFHISIPKCYPFTLPNADNISIIFKNVDLIGLPHINNDGSVCFHPEKDDNFERKLKQEINGLKTWIHDYYICKKEDENYTYLIHNTEINISSTLYFSDNEKTFSKGDFGTFQYSNFNDLKLGDGKTQNPLAKVQTFFKIGFDKGFEDKWSTDFLAKLKEKFYSGFWIYIEDEPIQDEVAKRRSIKSWDQLQKYLPDEFTKHLYLSFKGLGKSFFFDDNLFLLVGYKIPNADAYEVHWDLIKIPKRKLPVKSVAIARENRNSSQEKYFSECTNDKIIWGSTVNSNYERFFGRGKLSDRFVNSRILIIGCGALGSSLAEIFVRGGCKNITFDDFDYVASGNLCRSKYNLDNLNQSKVESLKHNLARISPYVNIFNIPLKLNHYSDMEEWLNQSIDYVFDCSTDTEVTYTFDKSNFISKVFSLSITNRAKELICVSGVDITRRTNLFYEFLGNELPTFFEGTGCGYPTFEANFNDINSLLGLAVMNINHQIENSAFINNFIIRQELKDGLKNISIQNFKEYFDSSNQAYLYIANNTLSKIRDELIRHFPKEFGGVFVGYRNGNEIIIDDVLVPDDYENGKTIFVRRPGTLNERLKIIHTETSGKIGYIGEWHSHPNAAAIPSQTDNNAMKQIAEDKKVGNPNPVLIIIKITENDFEPQAYIYHNKKLLKYEQ